MDHSTGLSYHPDTGVVYNSQAIFDLGHFLLRLQEPSLPSIVEHVRTLSFNLTYDNMVGSAIINILDARSPDPRHFHRLPGDLGVAADMCRSLLENYDNDTSRIPTRKWFQVIVRLVHCCTNVETIEVPPEWVEVQWYDNDFPKIDLPDPAQEKRQLGNSRWRFGKDPVVVRTYADACMEERSLDID